MSLVGQSFFSSEQLSELDIKEIFSRSKAFKHEFEKRKSFEHIVRGEVLKHAVVALVFAEPSTRTRMSFQVACARLGIRTLSLDNLALSSVSKGETLEDTFRNIAAMAPDMMIVRFNNNPEAATTLRQMSIPIVNGGIGTEEHPTQALLDAFTMSEFRGQVKGEKVLIVGDVLHSRVANSNLILLRKMGAEVAYCAPKELVPTNKSWQEVLHFSELSEGIRWASVVMGLRVQKERHQAEGIGLSIAEYREKYRLGGEQLKFLRADGIVLHPGPVIRGVEFSDHVMKDSRCKVLDQVTNGVFVRAALMSMILGLEVQTR